jgi:hypothetical protein
MPKYMLLFYAGEADAKEREERDADLPAWRELTDSLREAGLLLGTDRLHPVDSATTVRVRNGETEIVDGPFAVTKEYLGGYFLLECADLDEALEQAARVPLARYGSVEVRPVAEIALPVAGEDEAEAAP